jgi:hypothetical protein
VKFTIKLMSTVSVCLLLVIGACEEGEQSVDSGPLDARSVDVLADAPPESVADVGDGPHDGLMCRMGLRKFYPDPGCDAEAVAICAENDDGCYGVEICLCDGRTSRRCTWSESPFRHLGPCERDAGGDLRE